MINDLFEFRLRETTLVGPLLSMHILTRRGDSILVAEPLVMREAKAGDLLCEPTVLANNNSMQGLMDELWRCGFRPTEGQGSAGMMAAVEEHLKFVVDENNLHKELLCRLLSDFEASALPSTAEQPKGRSASDE